MNVTHSARAASLACRQPRVHFTGFVPLKHTCSLRRHTPSVKPHFTLLMTYQMFAYRPYQDGNERARTPGQTPGFRIKEPIKETCVCVSQVSKVVRLCQT